MHSKIARTAVGDVIAARMRNLPRHRRHSKTSIAKERRSYCTSPNKCAGSMAGVPGLPKRHSCLDVQGLSSDRVE